MNDHPGRVAFFRDNIREIFARQYQERTVPTATVTGDTSFVVGTYTASWV